MSKWGKFDFSEFEKLAKSFQKASDGKVIEKFIEDFLTEMAMRALRKTVKRTPTGKDTFNPGHLKRSWKITSVTKQGNEYVIELFNDADYALYVEYGHRQEVGRFVPAIGKRLKKPWVEGRFMMTISMKEIERELPGYLERRVTELMNDILRGR